MKLVHSQVRPNRGRLSYSRTIVLGYVTAILMALFAFSGSAEAAQSIPYKMNFQGRLTNAAGSPMADGLYNMKFRIFDAASSGTELWSETRETTARVQVTNGLFSVQLGEVTPLAPSTFNSSSTRYFEIELPTPASATCSTASCATWTEGAMTPRNPLGSSAYAFNADTIDGIDGANIAKLDGSSTFTAANTFSALTTFSSYLSTTGEISLSSTNSTTKLNVIDNSSSVLLRADTTNFIVKVGTTSAATLANVRLISTSAEFTGTVRIGSTTNGVDIGSTGITLYGTAKPTRSVNIQPEYAGAVFTGDGTDNVGSLSSDFCSATGFLNINATACGSSQAKTYYEWTTTQATAQDYDIYVRYVLPRDYDTGSMTNLRMLGWGTSTATEQVVLTMYDETSGTQCATTSNVITTNTTWQSVTVASPVTSCSSTAALDTLIFKVHVVAGQNNIARAGSISFDYKSKF